MEEIFCQKLETYILGKVLVKNALKTSRKKTKLKDKKYLKYATKSAVKGVKGTVQGVVGKPLAVVGLALGPLGLPIKLAGKTLKVKSVKNKAKSGAYTVLKLSRDSVRYG